MELEPQEAAERIAASAIREQLLAALVDWSNIRTEPATQKKLGDVIRLADDDPWRRQLFDTLDRKDWPALAHLAKQPEALGLSQANPLGFDADIS
jgi:hypothetical protein